jgi:hypothetical protein
MSARASFPLTSKINVPLIAVKLTKSFNPDRSCLVPRQDRSTCIYSLSFFSSNTKSYSFTSLHYAAEKADQFPDKLDRVIGSPSISLEARDEEGHTALHIATKFGQEKGVRKLLAAQLPAPMSMPVTAIVRLHCRCVIAMMLKLLSHSYCYLPDREQMSKPPMFGTGLPCSGPLTVISIAQLRPWRRQVLISMPKTQNLRRQCTGALNVAL